MNMERKGENVTERSVQNNRRKEIHIANRCQKQYSKLSGQCITKYSIVKDNLEGRVRKIEEEEDDK